MRYLRVSFIRELNKSSIESRYFLFPVRGRGLKVRDSVARAGVRARS